MWKNKNKYKIIGMISLVIATGITLSMFLGRDVESNTNPTSSVDEIEVEDGFQPRSVNENQPAGNSEERADSHNLKPVSNSTTPAEKRVKLELASVNRIWGGDGHDGFTTIIERNGTLFCAFRHASSHNSRDGKIQVIKSEDGDNWENEVILSLDGLDLRDPKLSINADGELVLIGLSRSSDAKNNRHLTHSWRKIQNNWVESQLGEQSQNTWKWGVNRVGGEIYTLAYSGKDKSGTLYSSNDGSKWSRIAERVFPEVENYPNESAFVALENGKLVCLLRKDKGDKKAKLGFSLPPYTKWEWTALDKQIGGPSLIQLPDGALYACVRLYGPIRTSICKVDETTGKLIEVIKLPSGNDTSYAGMTIFKGQLVVSYYSNHETGRGRAAIYLAKIAI